MNETIDSPVACVCGECDQYEVRVRLGYVDRMEFPNHRERVVLIQCPSCPRVARGYGKYAIYEAIAGWNAMQSVRR